MAIQPITNENQKKKTFKIIIEGSGIYEKDSSVPEGKKTFQLDVVDFFNKTGKEIGDSKVIDALRDYLMQTNPHEVNSIFHVEKLDYLSNENQPHDKDSIV